MTARLVWLLGAVAVAAASVPDGEIFGQELRVRVVDPAQLALAQIPKGIGQIAGQVREDSSRQGVAGAVVTLALGARPPIRVMTDGDGRFSFDALPAGEFALSATLSGYAEGANGRLRAWGTSALLTLADGQRVSNVAIVLWPLAAIGGSVNDDAGEPVIGVAVHAYRRSIAGGRWQFALAASDTTDDRGEFRIGLLEPGTYVVAVPMASFTWPASLEQHMLHGAEWPAELSALPDATRELIGTGIQISPKSPVVVQSTNRLAPAIGADGRIAAYTTQFFPGTADVTDATPIALAAGESRTGVSFVMRPARLSNISGTISGPAGALDDLPVRLIPATAAGDRGPFEAALSVSDGLGRFTFMGVPPGQYVIRVVRVPRGETVPPAMMMSSGRLVPATAGLPQPVLPKETLQWGEQTVTVGDADLTGVALALQSGLRIRGRAEFTGAAVKPNADTLSRISLILERADGRPATHSGAGRGRVEADAQFATVGVPGGRYVLRVTGVPRGWFLQGAIAGGRDITVDPIDLDADVTGVRLVFTDRTTTLSGTVTGAGAPDDMALVVVFPADPAAWIDRGPSPRRIRSVRTAGGGVFSIPDLPPGQYLIGVLNAARAADWDAPESLNIVSRGATRVELTAGEERQVSLQAPKGGS